MKRDFVFKLEEIVDVYDPNMLNNKKSVISYTTGTVIVDGEDVMVFVDDKLQPSGTFMSKDNFFNKIIKKIHGATK